MKTPELIGPEWVLSAQKRLTDVRRAKSLMICALPILMVASVSLQLEDGPPGVILQERMGQSDNPFKIIKLRTLRGPLNHDSSSGAVEKRATHLGQFLRSTRIDEFPQLLNILQGEMSFVGPRPLLPVDIVLMQEALTQDEFDEWQKAYTISRPGIYSTFSNGADQYQKGSQKYLYKRYEGDVDDYESASPARDQKIVTDGMLHTLYTLSCWSHRK